MDDEDDDCSYDTGSHVQSTQPTICKKVTEINKYKKLENRKCKSKSRDYASDSKMRNKRMAEK